MIDTAIMAVDKYSTFFTAVEYAIRRASSTVGSVVTEERPPAPAWVTVETGTARVSWGIWEERVFVRIVSPTGTARALNYVGSESTLSYWGVRRRGW